MSLSTFLESKNKELLTSLFEWQEKVRQYSVVINAQHTRIAELEKERDMWKSNHDNQVKLKNQLMDRPDLQDRAASIQRMQDKINDLEAWNEMLVETGHWIGQEEAYNLKAAVEKFLNKITDSIEGGWLVNDVENESLDELKVAVDNCSPFKSCSINSPPKHKEPPHSHPTQIQPQEFESPQTEPNQ